MSARSRRVRPSLLRRALYAHDADLSQIIYTNNIHWNGKPDGIVTQLGTCPVFDGRTTGAGIGRITSDANP